MILAISYVFFGMTFSSVCFLVRRAFFWYGVRSFFIRRVFSQTACVFSSGIFFVGRVFILNGVRSFCKSVFSYGVCLLRTACVVFRKACVLSRMACVFIKRRVGFSWYGMCFFVVWRVLFFVLRVFFLSRFFMSRFLYLFGVLLTRCFFYGVSGYTEFFYTDSLYLFPYTAT